MHALIGEHTVSLSVVQPLEMYSLVALHVLQAWHCRSLADVHGTFSYWLRAAEHAGLHVSHVSPIVLPPSGYLMYRPAEHCAWHTKSLSVALFMHTEQRSPGWKHVRQFEMHDSHTPVSKLAKVVFGHSSGRMHCLVAVLL